MFPLTWQQKMSGFCFLLFQGGFVWQWKASISWKQPSFIAFVFRSLGFLNRASQGQRQVLWVKFILLVTIQVTPKLPQSEYVIPLISCIGSGCPNLWEAPPISPYWPHDTFKHWDVWKHQVTIFVTDGICLTSSIITLNLITLKKLYNYLIMLISIWPF